MTKFSGIVRIPSRTLQLLAQGAGEHLLSVGRHAELCMIAALRLEEHPRIRKLAERQWTDLVDLNVCLSAQTLQDLAERSIDMGASLPSYMRALLVDAVGAMPSPVPKPDPGFRKFQPAKLIVERDNRIGWANFSMGDPSPGRSALDQKKNAQPLSRISVARV